MNEPKNPKYDFENRSFVFAQKVRAYLKSAKIQPLQFDDENSLSGLPVLSPQIILKQMKV